MPQKADAAVGRDNWTAVDGSETLFSGVLACGATAIGWGCVRERASVCHDNLGTPSPQASSV